MKIQVSVKTNSHQVGVKKLPDDSYAVAVRARAVDGLANEAVILALAEHFGVPKSRVKIVRGATSKVKWIEIG